MVLRIGCPARPSLHPLYKKRRPGTVTFLFPPSLFVHVSLLTSWMSTLGMLAQWASLTLDVYVCVHVCVHACVCLYVVTALHNLVCADVWINAVKTPMDLIQSPESFQVDRQTPSSSTYQCYVVQWSLVVMAVCDICDLCYWIEVLT